MHPMRSFNPILHGRGFTEPPLVDDLSWFLGGCSKWAKFNEFVSLNICHVLLKPFFKKRNLIFWKTEKNFFDQSDIKGSPLWKRKFKIKFFHLFSNKSYFFYPNLNFMCSYLFFLRYVTWVLFEIFKFSLFSYKIFIDNQDLSVTSHS